MPEARGGLPLRGVTVLDLTRAVAGPFCTMNLADLGARVIKIEEPGVGDETRHWVPPFLADGVSTYFLSMNRNKECREVDLKSAAGREEIRRLAREADVVVENFRTGVADRLGVGYADLSGENPRIIYASISGFGSEGEWAQKAGYDLIVQAMSGLMHVSAHPGGPPGKTATPIADLLAALYTSQAILAALWRREHEGVGARIEVSLLEAMLGGMAPFASAYLMAGREPQPAGTTQGNIAPYQVWKCADGLVAAGALNERQWRRFAGALGHGEWLEDARFASNGERVRHRAELTALIEAVMVRRPVAEWVRVLEEAELPCGAVWTVGQVLESEVVRERGTVVEGEGIRTVRSPMRIVGTEFRYERPKEFTRGKRGERD